MARCTGKASSPSPATSVTSHSNPSILSWANPWEGGRERDGRDQPVRELLCVLWRDPICPEPWPHSRGAQPAPYSPAQTGTPRLDDPNSITTRQRYRFLTTFLQIKRISLKSLFVYLHKENVTARFTFHIDLM